MALSVRPVAQQAPKTNAAAMVAFATPAQPAPKTNSAASVACNCSVFSAGFSSSSSSSTTVA